jgi:hypothetical protein
MTYASAGLIVVDSELFVTLYASIAASQHPEMVQEKLGDTDFFRLNDA